MDIHTWLWNNNAYTKFVIGYFALVGVKLQTNLESKLQEKG